MSVNSVKQLYETCCMFPELLDLVHDKLVLYLALLRHFKPQIQATLAASSTDVPDGLLLSVHEFIQLAVDIDDYTARLCWTALRHIAWDDKAAMPIDMCALIPLFLEHGVKLGVCKCRTDCHYIMLY